MSFWIVGLNFLTHEKVKLEWIGWNVLINQENKLRSFKTCYSHDILGKQKYLNLRKANKQAKFQGHSVSNYISYNYISFYKELAQVINSTDIGLWNISLIFAVITKILLVYIGSLLNSF